jgi:hypothetical protein
MDTEEVIPSGAQRQGQGDLHVWRAKMNYAALARLLPLLRNLVDACGDVWLTDGEAARIRALGFSAQVGRWRVPPLPPELVAGNPLLEPLSIGWEPPPPLRGHTFSEVSRGAGRLVTAARPQALVTPQPTTATAESYGEWPRVDGPRSSSGELIRSDAEVAAKVLAALRNAGGRVSKRRVQQKLWRFPAAVVNQALNSLASRGLVRRDGSWLCAESGPAGAAPVGDVTQTVTRTPVGDVR